jgi:hypothetical protein
VHTGTLTAFFGGVFDGHAVYLSPEGDGVVLRYDIRQPLTAVTSWSTFDTAVFHPDHLSFVGGAFDGQFVYFSPGGADSIVVRFDTKGTFANATSWAAVDLGLLLPSLGLFSGAAFDGRFLYITPTGTTNGAPNRLLARYDTTGKFDAPGSWQFIDLKKVGADPVGGSAFDGRFIYLMPERGSSLVARFEARETQQKLTLPAFFGSFF